MTNYANDEDINLDFEFDFAPIKNLKELIENMSRKSEIFDGYFMHLEDAYIIDETSALIKVTFGSFNKPLNKYIYIKDNKALYYQGNPLPTSSNIKAHNKIKALIV